MRASPAAAGALSRVLTEAGMTRNREYKVRRGVTAEFGGFYAGLDRGELRVEVLPDTFSILRGGDPVALTADVLAECEAILQAKGYGIVRRVERIYAWCGEYDGEVLIVTGRA